MSELMQRKHKAALEEASECLQIVIDERDRYKAALEKVRLKADGGLCSFTVGSKHVFLQEIKAIALEQRDFE